MSAQQLLSAATEKGWAYIGTDPQRAPESWVVLQVAEGGSTEFGWVVFYIHSKQRIKGEVLTDQQLLDEAAKIPILPAECGAVQVFIHVTNQHLPSRSRSMPKRVSNGMYIVPVFVDMQQLWWASASELMRHLREQQQACKQRQGT
jgi:hypothetical protein